MDPTTNAITNAITGTLRVDKITGTAREFLMLRRAVDFIKAVPTENLSADLNSALESINNYYSTQPATESISFNFTTAPIDTSSIVGDPDILVINGVTIVGKNGVQEFEALKAFGELLKAVLNNTSLHPDEVNALSEFKNFYSL